MTHTLCLNGQGLYHVARLRVSETRTARGEVGIHFTDSSPYFLVILYMEPKRNIYYNRDGVMT